ncbi:MAG: hypothetical protein V4622_08235 [Bacteroidota bacterium]
MENTSEEQKKRPVFLLVLAILSFITIGFGLIGNFLGLLAGPMSPSEMENVMASGLKTVESMQNSGMDSFSESFELIFRMQKYINSNFYPHILVTLLSLIVGFIGVLFMLKGNKKGFHLYIIYNLINVATIYVSVPANEVPNVIIISNVIFAGLFVFLYSRNLHWMK